MVERNYTKLEILSETVKGFETGKKDPHFIDEDGHIDWKDSFVNGFGIMRGRRGLNMSPGEDWINIFNRLFIAVPDTLEILYPDDKYTPQEQADKENVLRDLGIL